MLNSIVSLLEVHETGVQDALSKIGMVNEKSKSKQIVDSRSARFNSSLSRAAQAMLFTPMHQMVIEDDDVEEV